MKKIVSKYIYAKKGAELLEKMPDGTTRNIGHLVITPESRLKSEFENVGKVVKVTALVSEPEKILKNKETGETLHHVELSDTITEDMFEEIDDETRK